MRSTSLLFAVSAKVARPRIRMMSSPSNPLDSKISRTNILAESWSTVSNGYDKVLVPRFAPWTNDALDSLRNAINDNMKCSRDESMKSLVLCCGPGQELLQIAKILGPTSTVLGTDLAPGMIDVAKKRIEKECSQYEEYKGRISVEVGDAMNPPPGPYQVLFSAFGLQQLPKPIQAIQSWIQVMEPGGICVCIYWSPSVPKAQDDNSPFTLWTDIVKRKLGKDTHDEPWDKSVEMHVTSAGAEIIQDQFIAHDICWDNFDDMFNGLSRAGPWHALRLRRGDEFVDELGKELKAYYPPGKSLCHESMARLLVVRRKEGAEEEGDYNISVK